MGADSEQGKKKLIKDFCVEAHKLAGAEQDKGLGALGYYAARDLGTKCYDAGFQAGVESAKEKIQFILNLLETYGSIGECPYEASSDLEKQIKTYHCYGCDAEGYSSWPDWKVEFTHEMNCKWVDVTSLSLQGSGDK